MLLSFLHVVLLIPPEKFSPTEFNNNSITFHPVTAKCERDFLFLIL